MSEKSYDVYFLKQNPFGNWSDPNAPMAGRKKEQTEWESTVNMRRGSNANAIRFVVGDYGFGKTLTLTKIYEQYKSDPEILPIFMKMLPEDKVAKFGVDFIQRIFRRVPLSVFQCFKIKDIDALKAVYPEPANIFLSIAVQGVGAIEFLQGQKSFGSAELKKLGVQRKIDRTDIAKEYLVSFLFLLKQANINTLLIAVDETEYVFSQMTGANISLVFNTLRDLYDLTTSPAMQTLPGSKANMIFFFAISSAGWGKLSDLSHREQTQGGPINPLMDRVFQSPIMLQALLEEEAKDLIEFRLRGNRTKGTKPLIPYDLGFVKYVQELALGNPRQIIKFCDFALEDGLIEGISLLDRKFAEKVFIAHGLIPSPD